MIDDIEQIKKHGTPIRVNEQGYQICYYYRQFFAIKEAYLIRADTEKELEILIKNHAADLRRFKPIEVIRIEDGVRGRLTSRVSDREDELYFSYSEDGEKKHTKERLMDYSWGFEKEKKHHTPKFVEVTPKNSQILTDIQKEQEAIEACERAIEKLKKQFEKPVTWETVEKAAGEKS
jgi:hypothetical protein